MSENFRLDRKIGFRNMFYTKCINVIIDSIGPSIILRSILNQNQECLNILCPNLEKTVLSFSVTLYAKNHLFICFETCGFPKLLIDQSFGRLETPL